jgi:outer membrane protein assembly factor BamB
VFFLALVCAAPVARAANLFVSDFAGQIYEYTPAGDRTTFADGVGGGGMAFDNAGNLFQADHFSGRIYKYSLGGQRSTFASGLTVPWGLVFDAAGNLFAGENLSFRSIYKFTPDGGRTLFATSTIGNPGGLVFDAGGNLYSANADDRSILKFAPDGSHTTFVSDIFTPSALAFDKNGILFVTSGPTIFKVTPDGARSTFAFGPSGGSYLEGLAFDASGNLFVADWAFGAIYKYTPNGDRTTFASGLVRPTAVVFAFPVPEPGAFLMGVMAWFAFLHVAFTRRVYAREHRAYHS